MNMMMIRLLSSISLAVVAILGADLSASTKTETATKKTDADMALSKTTAADSVKKEEPKPTPVAITEKTMAEVESMLSSATIVDARGSGDETIKGAIFLAANADDKDIQSKLKDKTAMIVVYCGSVSCPASTTLAERLVGMGYTNICHYAGGIKEWTENKKPVDKPKA
jgi:rhodanese-related sulfurtransferase